MELVVLKLAGRYLSWVRRLGEETVAVIDNIVLVVIKFSERPVCTDGKRQTVVHENRLNTFSWNIPWIYHQVVVYFVL